MSNYLPLVTKEYKFEGDNVKVSFKLLSRKQMMDLLPLMPEKKDSAMSVEQQAELMKVSLSALEENIKEFTGLKDANGNAIPVEEAIAQSYFLTLFSDITEDMFKESMIEEEEEEKKLTE